MNPDGMIQRMPDGKIPEDMVEMLEADIQAEQQEALAAGHPVQGTKKQMDKYLPQLSAKQARLKKARRKRERTARKRNRG